MTNRRFRLMVCLDGRWQCEGTYNWQTNAEQATDDYVDWYIYDGVLRVVTKSSTGER